jgi:hypothetical protein
MFLKNIKRLIKFVKRYTIFSVICLFIDIYVMKFLVGKKKSQFKKDGIKEIIVRLFNGKKMILDANDTGLSYDLLFDPKKQREEYASNYIIEIFKIYNRNFQKKS